MSVPMNSPVRAGSSNELLPPGKKQRQASWSRDGGSRNVWSRALDRERSGAPDHDAGRWQGQDCGISLALALLACRNQFAKNDRKCGGMRLRATTMLVAIQSSSAARKPGPVRPNAAEEFGGNGPNG